MAYLSSSPLYLYQNCTLLMMMMMMMMIMMIMNMVMKMVMIFAMMCLWHILPLVLCICTGTARC